MKKILISLISMVALILLWTGSSFAAKLEATVSVTPSSTEIKPGNTVTFSIKVKDIANAEGGMVYAVAGAIAYDKNFFEDLSYTLITLNEETGKFAGMGSYANNADIGTVTLKVKNNATGTGVVTFSTLTASDGRDDYEQGEATTSDVSISIKAKEEDNNNSGNSNNGETNNGDTNNGNSNNGETNNGGTNSGNSGNSGTTNDGTNNGNSKSSDSNTIETNKQVTQRSTAVDNKLSANKLPKAGATIMILPIIGILSIISIIIFKKYRKYNGI